MQKLAIGPLGAAGRIIGGELPNTEHVFDVSLGQAYALRRLGPASIRLAAARAFDQLAARFHSSNTAKWRDPRAMFDVASQGAESAGFAISPDRKWLLFAPGEVRQGDLYLVDNIN